MIENIPEWAITFWPIWPTIILFLFFGLLSIILPIFAGPWGTEGDSFEMVMMLSSWISGAIWLVWGLLWLAKFTIQAICWVAGCNA